MQRQCDGMFRGRRHWAVKVGLSTCCLALQLTAFLLLQGGAEAQPRTRTFTGRAYNEAGGLGYVERHTVVYGEGGVVEGRTTYFDPEGRVIGSLVSEYAASPQFNDYTFIDERNRYMDGVRLKEDAICLFRRTDPGAEEETACLERKSNQIVGQGFHHFIVEHLDDIAQGQVFQVRLALPSRLDVFDFRIRRTGLEANRVRIRLESDHWYVRWFAPHIDVLYDRQGRLLRYEGISNISDATGECIPVDIRYEHPTSRPPPGGAPGGDTGPGTG